MERYLALTPHAPGFTLLPPFGGAPTKHEDRIGSPITRSLWSSEKKITAESELLPSALAFGADVVRVPEHPSRFLGSAIASGASHVGIEVQRHHVGGNHDHDHHEHFPHDVTPGPSALNISTVP